jgi:hypothetical protein
MVVTAHAEISHVIAISVDGLRGDYLKSFLNATPAEFPNFIRLRNSGAYTFNARCDYGYSETVPNHLTMITGRPVLQPVGLSNTWHHGFSSNFPTTTATVHANGNPSVPYKTSVFDVVHDHGLSTALYLGKTRLEIMARSYNGTYGGLDATGVDNGRAKIDFLRIQDGLTSSMVTTLRSRIAGPLEAFTFFHITDPDTSGHTSGWTDVPGPYRTSIKTVDDYLGSIFATLDAQPALNGKVAIVLTGDHGGGGGLPNDHTNATLAQNYTVPFFLIAPGVKAGSDIHNVLENRFDPGTSRPTYADLAQPVRNGDLANLSVALLGLPMIPGALIQPELIKPLVVTLVAGKLQVSWPRYLSGFKLEATSELKAGEWQAIASGIVEGGDDFNYTVDATTPRRFFRLRRPGTQ